MIKQKHEGRYIWMVPGGAIEEGETAVRAAVREVKEETCLDVEIERLIWHVEEISEERGQRFVNFFLGRIISGEAALGADPEFDDEHQVMCQLKFMDRQELQETENVYPEYLRDEIWELQKRDFEGGNAYKDRY